MRSSGQVGIMPANPNIDPKELEAAVYTQTHSST